MQSQRPSPYGVTKKAGTPQSIASISTGTVGLNSFKNIEHIDGGDHPGKRVPEDTVEHDQRIMSQSFNEVAVRRELRLSRKFD